MASPFNIFRRNQRMMMVVLTVLSMFAFVFFDVAAKNSGGLSKMLTVGFFAAVCGLGLWFVGSRRGQGSEWGFWGAAIGALAAFIFVRSVGPETVVHGNGIQINETDLRKFADRRYKVNRFVFEASKATNSVQGAQGFGATDERSMVQYLMGRKEAQRLGISLSDQAVNRYVQEITGDKLSTGSFHDILKDLGISEGDLFSYLRDELEVRLAIGVQAPPYDTWMDFDFQTRQSFFRPMLRATPEEQWETFRKLNVKESLSVVALPVNAFLSKVEEPADVELEQLFTQYKSFLPSNQGVPGFLQPRRVQLAYLAAEYAKFESQATPPTDEEIALYYEVNKERFQVNEFPDELPDSDGPADANDPENIVPVIPEPAAPTSEEPAATPTEAKSPSEEPKSDEAPKEESSQEATPENEKPADPPAEPKSESKPEPESKPEKPAGEEQSRADVSAPIRLVALTTETETTENKTPEAPAETPAENSKPEENPTESKPAAESTEEKPETQTELPNSAESDVNDPFPVELPSPSGGEMTQPVHYRPLNDELRAEIRDMILRNRTFEKMGEAADKAQKFMEDKSFQYQGKNEEERKQLAKSFAEELKEYATNHSLTYVETSLLSQTEMQNSATEPIGAAMLTTGSEMSFQAPSVVDDLFPGSGGGQNSPLYVPQRADSRLRTHRFAYWKTQDVAQHVPEWTDNGIKEQVRTAWQVVKAGGLALKRGQELLELAKQKPEDLAAALSGQTITGEAGTEGVTIKETPRFSWLTTQMTTPFDQDLSDFMSPRLSFIDGVDQQGEDFMRTVFDELKVGEVGLVANYPKTEIYLVKIRERDATEPAPEDVEGYQTLEALRGRFMEMLGSDRLGFATRAYNLMRTDTFLKLQQEWTKSFDQRYGINMDQVNQEAAKRQSPQG